MMYESCIDVALPTPQPSTESSHTATQIISNLMPYLEHPQLYDLMCRIEHNEAHPLLHDVARFSDNDSALSELIEHSPKHALLQAVILARASAFDKAINIETYKAMAKSPVADKAKLLLCLAVNDHFIDKDLVSDVGKLAENPTAGPNFLTAIALAAPYMPKDCAEEMRNIAVETRNKGAMLVCDLQEALQYSSCTECNVFMGTVVKELFNPQKIKTTGDEVLNATISRAMDYDKKFKQIGEYAYKSLASTIKEFLTSETYQKALYKSLATEKAIEKALSAIEKSAKANRLFVGPNGLSIFCCNFLKKETVLNIETALEYGKGNINFKEDKKALSNASLESLKETRAFILEAISKIEGSYRMMAIVAYSLSPIYNEINNRIKTLERNNRGDFTAFVDEMLNKQMDIDDLGVW